MRLDGYLLALVLSVLVVGFWSGCDITVADPKIEIVVNESDGTFEFVVQRDRWWTRRSEMVPHKITHFFIADSKSILWDVQSRDVGAGVSTIKYVVLPPSFEQLTPKLDNAPPLTENVEYTAVATTGGSGSIKFVYGSHKGGNMGASLQRHKE
jgi:hypothetical protein